MTLYEVEVCLAQNMSLILHLDETGKFDMVLTHNKTFEQTSVLISDLPPITIPKGFNIWTTLAATKHWAELRINYMWVTMCVSKHKSLRKAIFNLSESWKVPATTERYLLEKHGPTTEWLF